MNRFEKILEDQTDEVVTDLHHLSLNRVNFDLFDKYGGQELRVIFSIRDNIDRDLRQKIINKYENFILPA